MTSIPDHGLPAVRPRSEQAILAFFPLAEGFVSGARHVPLLTPYSFIGSRCRGDQQQHDRGEERMHKLGVEGGDHVGTVGGDDSGAAGGPAASKLALQIWVNTITTSESSRPMRRRPMKLAASRACSAGRAHDVDRGAAFTTWGEARAMRRASNTMARVLIVS
jgi:hypothetical protein